MGAGASAASMPLPERRELYAELRDKYTRSDLDGLAEEEKQAWLEVIEGHREAAVKEAAEVGLQASSQGTAALDSTAPEGKTGGFIEKKKKSLSKMAVSDHTRCSVLGQSVIIREAAEAAAALTDANGGRKSVWDLSGESNTGVRPQENKTRMSYFLASETDGADGNGGGDGDGDGGGTAADGGGGRHGSSPEGGEGSHPAWMKTAEKMETPNELCVGDIVRARDKDFNGMWFEGVLTAIHDETTFEVELTGDEQEEDAGSSPQRITVGINDVLRVMPWFCIEVGDMVECQLEGTMAWARGTVVNVDRALYDVALESEFVEDQWAGEESKAGRIEDDGARDDGGGKENEEERVLYGIPDSRIRKIISGRQAAAKRWRKMYLASLLTSGLGRLINETRTRGEAE
ncbi:unnamed protein product [Pylaiella littoralis]